MVKAESSPSPPPSPPPYVPPDYDEEATLIRALEETEREERRQWPGLGDMLEVTSTVPDIAVYVPSPPLPPPPSTPWYEAMPLPWPPPSPVDDHDAQLREVIRDLVGTRWTFEADSSELLPPPPAPSAAAAGLLATRRAVARPVLATERERAAAIKLRQGRERNSKQELVKRESKKGGCQAAPIVDGNELEGVATAAERARCRGRRRRRVAAGNGVGGGGAEPEVLRVDVPQRGDAGPRRRHPEAAGDLQRRARHPPPLLPRLLRQGVRRLCAHLGPGRRAQRGRGHDAVAGRAGPHHPRQGRRGRRRRLLQQGLLRRHPRPRHPRRRPAGGRSVLPGGAGAAGRQGGDARRREAQPPRRRLLPGPAQQALLLQRPHPDRHDRSLRGAHDRGDALRQVRAAAVPVQGGQAAVQPADEPGLPAADAGDVPAQLQPGHRGHARRRHAAQVRQRLLPDAAAAEGPAVVRPGALRRPPLPGHRQPLRRQPDRLLRCLRRRHGQARPHRGQDRRLLRRRDPQGLHQGQLIHNGRAAMVVASHVHSVERVNGWMGVLSSVMCLSSSDLLTHVILANLFQPDSFLHHVISV